MEQVAIGQFQRILEKIRQDRYFDGIYTARVFISHNQEKSMTGTNSYDPDNFDDVAWLEDITDELDGQDYLDNDQTLYGELGFEDEVAANSSHSKRSRQMKHEYFDYNERR